MVRNYKRRSGNKQYGQKQLSDAVRAVIQNGMRICDVAQQYNIKAQSLSYHVNKLKDKEVDWDEEIIVLKNHNQILSIKHEENLEKYLLDAAEVYVGLKLSDLRSLAYKYAVSNNVTTPPSWIKNEAAGSDWLRGFMNRHKKLAVRVPEATSLARISGFNQYNVNTFFDNLSIEEQESKKKRTSTSTEKSTTEKRKLDQKHQVPLKKIKKEKDSLKQINKTKRIKKEKVINIDMKENIKKNKKIYYAVNKNIQEERIMIKPKAKEENIAENKTEKENKSIPLKNLNNLFKRAVKPNSKYSEYVC